MEIEQPKLKFPKGTTARIVPYKKSFLVLITWPDGREVAEDPTTDVLEYFGLLDKFAQAEESLTLSNLLQSIDKALLSKPKTGLRSKQNIDLSATQSNLKPVKSAYAKYIKG
jgi:hypothetical protein